MGPLLLLRVLMSFLYLPHLSSVLAFFLTTYPCGNLISDCSVLNVNMHFERLYGGFWNGDWMVLLRLYYVFIDWKIWHFSHFVYSTFLTSCYESLCVCTCTFFHPSICSSFLHFPCKGITYCFFFVMWHGTLRIIAVIV